MNHIRAFISNVLHNILMYPSKEKHHKHISHDINVAQQKNMYAIIHMKNSL